MFTPKRILRVLLLALFSGALTLATMPSDADARAGGSRSSGSRGTQTFKPTPAKPIERTITQPQTQKPGMATPAPGQPSPAFGGRPFMQGLMGGLLGAGLVGLLFGGAHFGAEGFSGMLGMMLQFAVIGLVLYAAFALFRRMRQPQPATARVGLGSAEPEARLPAPSGAQVLERGPAITDADKEAFGHVLAEVQYGWSEGDIGRLRSVATPEMLSYFADDLTEAASLGRKNVVKDVTLVNGEVVEDWVEDGMQYATAVMTWRAIDYTTRGGKVEDGDPNAPVEATEAWTFVRRHGGIWLLSAIQQT